MKKQFLLILLFLAAHAIQAQTYQYTVKEMPLKEGPGMLFKSLIPIPTGTAVEVSETCDCEWTKILYDKKIGYIQTKNLSDKKPIGRLTSFSSPDSSPQPQSEVRYYKNSQGEKVQSPTRYNQIPKGATALCKDGTYSFSRSRRGTCSGHGGVARWL